MLVSIALAAGLAAGARRVLRRGVAVRRDAVVRRDACVRRGAARRALRAAVRLTERFPVFFLDAFLLDAFLLVVLRGFAVFFAIFRRFLAMRAPPVNGRAYSNLIIFQFACSFFGYCPHSCSWPLSRTSLPRSPMMLRCPSSGARSKSA